jgi:HD superfamily phosphodiesterase
MNIELQDRWNKLSEFVGTTCFGRDSSHGYEHMKTVAQISLDIIEREFNDRPNYHNLRLDAMTAAWLHDIADHKYDKEGILEQQLDEFGKKNITNYKEIKQVIKYVSYSSENKTILAGTPLDYDSILTPYYALVRHIVSDADKLEAIGKEGVVRAYTYSKHANPTYTHAQVIADVHKHAKEKLLRLASEFIRTNTGRMLAQQKHDEMVNELTHL